MKENSKWERGSGASYPLRTTKNLLRGNKHSQKIQKRGRLQKMRENEVPPGGRLPRGFAQNTVKDRGGGEGKGTRQNRKKCDQGYGVGRRGREGEEKEKAKRENPYG